MSVVHKHGSLHVDYKIIYLVNRGLYSLASPRLQEVFVLRNSLPVRRLRVQ